MIAYLFNNINFDFPFLLLSPFRPKKRFKQLRIVFPSDEFAMESSISRNRYNMPLMIVAP